MMRSSISKLFNLNDSNWGRGSGNSGGPNSSGPNNGPGGNRPRGEGPPDLDELWRDFNRKLNGLFGRRGGGGSGGGFTPAPKGAGIGVGLVAGVVFLLWAASGFFIVQEGQKAVITQFGRYKATTGAGFQWRLPYPIQAHEVVNVSATRKVEIGYRGTTRSKVLKESLMLTDDENIVDILFEVQYRLKDDGAREYLFINRSPDEAVMQTAETAMREVVGKKAMDSVLYEGRQVIANDVLRGMQQMLDRYGTGILVTSVNIQNAQPPEQVQAAFDDAVKAGQDRERQINEGQAYANDVVPRARGMASRLLQEADGYRTRVIETAQGEASRFKQVHTEYSKAPQVTRDRLYLDTMQQVFTNTSKVLIDTRSNGNLLYLPLDKLIQQSAQDGGIGRGGVASPLVKPSDASVGATAESDARARDSRSRDRETR
jgi:membrane protease subunit HflK